eukprot:tig00021758_g23401.t1
MFPEREHRWEAFDRAVADLQEIRRARPLDAHCDGTTDLTAALSNIDLVGPEGVRQADLGSGADLTISTDTVTPAQPTPAARRRRRQRRRAARGGRCKPDGARASPPEDDGDDPDEAHAAGGNGTERTSRTATQAWSATASSTTTTVTRPTNQTQGPRATIAKSQGRPWLYGLTVTDGKATVGLRQLSGYSNLSTATTGVLRLRGGTRRRQKPAEEAPATTLTAETAATATPMTGGVPSVMFTAPTAPAATLTAEAAATATPMAGGGPGVMFTAPTAPATTLTAEAAATATPMTGGVPGVMFTAPTAPATTLTAEAAATATPMAGGGPGVMFTAPTAPATTLTAEDAAVATPMTGGGPDVTFTAPPAPATTLTAEAAATAMPMAGGGPDVRFTAPTAPATTPTAEDAAMAMLMAGGGPNVTVDAALMATLTADAALTVTAMPDGHYMVRPTNRPTAPATYVTRSALATIMETVPMMTAAMETSATLTAGVGPGTETLIGSRPAPGAMTDAGAEEPTATVTGEHSRTTPVERSAPETAATLATGVGLPTGVGPRPTREQRDTMEQLTGDDHEEARPESPERMEPMEFDDAAALHNAQTGNAGYGINVVDVHDWHPPPPARRHDGSGDIPTPQTQIIALAQMAADAEQVPQNAPRRRHITETIVRAMSQRYDSNLTLQVAMTVDDVDLVGHLLATNTSTLLEPGATMLEAGSVAMWGNTSDVARWLLLRRDAARLGVDVGQVALQQYSERKAVLDSLISTGEFVRYRPTDEPDRNAPSDDGGLAAVDAIQDIIDRNMQKGVSPANTLQQRAEQQIARDRHVAFGLDLAQHLRAMWRPEEMVQANDPTGPVGEPPPPRFGLQSSLSLDDAQQGTQEGAWRRQAMLRIAYLTRTTAGWEEMTDVDRFDGLKEEAIKRSLTEAQTAEALMNDWRELLNLTVHMGYLRQELIDGWEQWISPNNQYVYLRNMIQRLDGKRARDPTATWYTLFRDLAAKALGLLPEGKPTFSQARATPSQRAHTEVVTKLQRTTLRGAQQDEYSLPHPAAWKYTSRLLMHPECLRTSLGPFTSAPLARSEMYDDINDPYKMRQEFPRRSYATFLQRQSPNAWDAMSKRMVSYAWRPRDDRAEELHIYSPVEVQAAKLQQNMPHFRRAWELLVMLGFYGYKDPFYDHGLYDDTAEPHIYQESQAAAASARELPCLGQDSVLALFDVDPLDYAFFTQAEYCLIPALIVTAIELGRHLAHAFATRGWRAPITVDTQLVEQACAAKTMEEANRYLILAARSIETPPAVETCPDLPGALLMRCRAQACALTHVMALGHTGYDFTRDLLDGGYQPQWLQSFFSFGEILDLNLPSAYTMTYAVKLGEQFLNMVARGRVINGDYVRGLEVPRTADPEDLTLFTETAIGSPPLRWNEAFTQYLEQTDSMQNFIEMVASLLYDTSMAIDLPLPIVDDDMMQA